MWLTKIKIAIVERDSDKLNLLLDETPEFKNRDDMEEAMYLLKEAAELIYTLQGETKNSMKQIRANIDFLKSTQAPALNRLDITS